jgi:DNA-binding NarL/FixJ family response regulator
MCNPVQLSDREREIVKARAKGLGYKQIAGELNISVNTVKTHFSRIFVKLDVQCSLELLQQMQAQDCQNCPFRGPRRLATRGSRIKILGA